MNKKDLLGIYDNDYAEDYDQRFLLEPGYKSAAEYELLLLKTFIDTQTNWLDVGCGTGFFLSKFKGVNRGGLDLSPEMLKIAQKNNPDASFFRQEDFRNTIPEWKNSFSLVTCMWGPYVYLNSQTEIENFIKNIIEWTASNGTLFLPVIDYEDYRPPIEIPYIEETYTKDNVSYGQTIIKSFTWDYIEYIGKSHKNLVSLHLNYMVELISPYFKNIEICYYPLDKDEKVPRKAIIAKHKTLKFNINNETQIKWIKPLFNLKATNNENSIATVEFSKIGLSFFIKRTRIFHLGFWRNVFRFLTK